MKTDNGCLGSKKATGGQSLNPQLEEQKPRPAKVWGPGVKHRPYCGEKGGNLRADWGTLAASGLKEKESDGSRVKE